MDAAVLAQVNQLSRHANRSDRAFYYRVWRAGHRHHHSVVISIGRMVQQHHPRLAQSQKYLANFSQIATFGKIRDTFQH
jgi:hypothetical protein